MSHAQKQVDALVRKFRKLRIEQGVTQTKINEETLVSRDTIAGWENFIRSPHIEKFARVLNHLGYELVIRKRKQQ
jgi:transcriptional regulator with XRE-family HTH domain